MRRALSLRIASGTELQQRVREQPELLDLCANWVTEKSERSVRKDGRPKRQEYGNSKMHDLCMALVKGEGGEERFVVGRGIRAVKTKVAEMAKNTACTEVKARVRLKNGKFEVIEVHPVFRSSSIVLYNYTANKGQGRPTLPGISSPVQAAEGRLFASLASQALRYSFSLLD